MSTKKIILTILLFILCCGVVSAWTGPSSTPPNSNTSAPINVGPNPQIKQGILGVDTGYSIKAPIYYDYPSTSYYVDPSSVSAINDLYTYDDIFVGSSAIDDGADLYIADKIYDWDNTGYYLNPGGTSRMNAITPNGITLGGVWRTTWPTFAGDNLGNHTATQDLLFNNYGIGVVGSYSATRYQNVFSMGSAYTPADNGTSLSNMYGIAWTHSNVGGESIAGLSHQALFVAAGDTKTAIGNGVWTKYNVTGNAFYDQNNTGYYVNPASTSILSRIYAYDRLYVGSSASDDTSDMFIADKLYDWDNTGYYIDPASTSKFSGINLGGVTRTSWPSSGLTSEADTLQTVTNRGKTTSQYIQSNSSMRAPIFYDSNNTGYYIDPASTSRMNAITPNGITLGGVWRTTWPENGGTTCPCGDCWRVVSYLNCPVPTQSHWGLRQCTPSGYSIVVPEVCGVGNRR